ncbi:MAG: hypothetical protein Q6L60_11240 [Thermostichus sp. HHBFW_bins_43]
MRGWIEYGPKQSKDELGWAEYRLAHYQDIEKWWELMYHALLLVGFIGDGNRKNKTRSREEESREEFRNNPRWEEVKFIPMALDVYLNSVLLCLE